MTCWPLWKGALTAIAYTTVTTIPALVIVVGVSNLDSLVPCNEAHGCAFIKVFAEELIPSTGDHFVSIRNGWPRPLTTSGTLGTGPCTFGDDPTLPLNSAIEVLSSANKSGSVCSYLYITNGTDNAVKQVLRDRLEETSSRKVMMVAKTPLPFEISSALPWLTINAIANESQAQPHSSGEGSSNEYAILSIEDQVLTSEDNYSALLVESDEARLVLFHGNPMLDDEFQKESEVMQKSYIETAESLESFSLIPTTGTFTYWVFLAPPPRISAIIPAKCPNMTMRQMRDHCETDKVKTHVFNPLKNGISKTIYIYCVLCWAALKMIHDIFLLCDFNEMASLSVGAFSVLFQGFAVGAAFVWSSGASEVFAALATENGNHDCACYYKLPSTAAACALATPAALFVAYVSKFRAFIRSAYYGDYLYSTSYDVPYYLARQSTAAEQRTLLSGDVAGCVVTKSQRNIETGRMWILGSFCIVLQFQMLLIISVVLGALAIIAPRGLLALYQLIPQSCMFYFVYVALCLYYAYLVAKICLLKNARSQLVSLVMLLPSLIGVMKLICFAWGLCHPIPESIDTVLIGTWSDLIPSCFSLITASSFVVLVAICFSQEALEAFDIEVANDGLLVSLVDLQEYTAIFDASLDAFVRASLRVSSVNAFVRASLRVFPARHAESESASASGQESESAFASGQEA